MSFLTRKDSRTETASLSSGFSVPLSESSVESNYSWCKVSKRRESIMSANVDCVVHIWSPSPHDHQREKSLNPRGVVCALHGLPGHFQSPTDRYLPDLLSRYNYIVYGMDFPGYGHSRYEKEPSAKDLVQHGVNLALFAHVKHPNLPLFVCGTGSGGTMALLVTNLIQKLSKTTMKVSGVVLLEPLISLQGLNCVSNQLSSKLSSFMPKQPSLCLTQCGESHQDYIMEEEHQSQLLSPSTRHLKRSHQTLIQLITMLKKSLHEFSSPFICLAGKDEASLNCEGVKDLMYLSSSDDKTLLEYNDEIHSFKVRSQDIMNAMCMPSGRSTLYNYNARAIRRESEYLDSKHRRKVELDTVSWLHSRTIGVEHSDNCGDLMRSDTQARRNCVIDDLEKAFDLW